MLERRRPSNRRTGSRSSASRQATHHPPSHRVQESLPRLWTQLFSNSWYLETQISSLFYLKHKFRSAAALPASQPVFCNYVNQASNKVSGNIHQSPCGPGEINNVLIISKFLFYFLNLMKHERNKVNTLISMLLNISGLVGERWS